MGSGYGSRFLRLSGASGMGKRQVFRKGLSSVFLLLVWVVVFNAPCAAAPLMVEKNLFSTDRKPPSPESVDTSSKSEKPGLAVGNIQLDGVMIQSGEKKAVLRMKTQPQGAAANKGQSGSPFVTVREGQMVSDYRVSKIEPKSILLEKDGETFTVSLFAANKVLSPVAPVPAPVQPQPAAPPPEVGADQPPEAQGQPGVNPQRQRQSLPGQAAAGQPSPNNPPGGSRNRAQAGNPNVQDPAAEPAMQDQNQPAETIEEQ
jgi:hypothetical protein